MAFFSPANANVATANANKQMLKNVTNLFSAIHPVGNAMEN